VIVTPDETAVHEVRPDEKGISTAIGEAVVVTRTVVEVVEVVEVVDGPVARVVDGTWVVEVGSSRRAGRAVDVVRASTPTSLPPAACTVPSVAARLLPTAAAETTPAVRTRTVNDPARAGYVNRR